MNHHPRRGLQGSLIERAADLFQLEPGRLPAADPIPSILAPSAAPAPPAALAPAPAVPLAAAPLPRPRPQRRRAAIDRDLLAQHGLLSPGGAVSVLAEEFRLAKRQLLLTARAVAGEDAARARMILVCSAKPNEGKTFCAINLAISMAAEQDVEILLVDADLAKPDILARLGIGEGPGLLDALNDPTVDIEGCIVDTDIPKLAVLPAGTRSTNDTELLASDHARRLLEGLAAADANRIIIFDSPPALSASPASVLALHVGQAMMVVRADRTAENDLRRAVALLDGCQRIQLLLNAVTYLPGDTRFGSYYGTQEAQ